MKNSEQCERIVLLRAEGQADRTVTERTTRRERPMNALGKILGIVGLLLLITGSMRMHDASGGREQAIPGILVLHFLPGAGLMAVSRVLAKKEQGADGKEQDDA